MSASQSNLSQRITRLLWQWRWRWVCLGVAAITYGAVFVAMRLPSQHASVTFVVTAFPAALLQFLLIDFARTGIVRTAPKTVAEFMESDDLEVRRVVETPEPSDQPRTTRVSRPQERQRILSEEKLGLS